MIFPAERASCICGLMCDVCVCFLAATICIRRYSFIIGQSFGVGAVDLYTELQLELTIEFATNVKYSYRQTNKNNSEYSGKR